MVSGSIVEGRFVPEGAEAEYQLDFEMPGEGYYGVVAVDHRMDPPVRCGDMVIACPEISLSPGAPAVAKIEGALVMGSYHPVGKGLVRLVPSNDRYPPVEAKLEGLDWIHATVITVPGYELKRRRGRPRADA